MAINVSRRLSDVRKRLTFPAPGAVKRYNERRKEKKLKSVREDQMKR